MLCFEDVCVAFFSMVRVARIFHSALIVMCFIFPFQAVPFLCFFYSFEFEFVLVFVSIYMYVCMDWAIDVLVPLRF